MTIPVFDLTAHLAPLREEVLAAIAEVLDSGRLVLGPRVERFEEEFARWVGGGAGLGVGVNSGTDALIVALRALGVGPGDEVVTVANTAVPTVSAIRALGAVPVFCDVVPETCLMDVDRLEPLLTERTRAVVPVHLFGNVVDVERIRRLTDPRGIAVLEDCAQAHGATLRGRMAGTMGHAAAFSFYPTKNLGACGDGGLCYTTDPRLAETMRSIRMYGFRDRYYAEREGINSRLDELQAAILSVKLRHLPRFLERRRALARRYLERLPAGVTPVRASPGVEHAYHLFVVRVPDRDRVRERMAERGVNTAVHYPWPIHLMTGYAFLGHRPGSLPHTEALADEIVSLPMYPELEEDAVDRVCTALGEAVGA